MFAIYEKVNQAEVVQKRGDIVGKKTGGSSYAVVSEKVALAGI